MIPGKGTRELADILVTENTPEAIMRSRLGTERDRGLEEDANIGEFVLEAREEGGEGFFMLREVLVAETLIVIYIADLAELKLTFLLPPCSNFRVCTPTITLRLLPHHQQTDLLSL